MAIDPAAATAVEAEKAGEHQQASAAPPTTPVQRGTPHATPPANRRATEPKGDQRRLPKPIAHLDGGATLEIAPGWGGFLQAGVGVAWRRVELRLVGSGWLPRTRQTRREPAISGRFSLWSAGVLGCPVVRPHARVSIPLCAGLHAGAMIGRGTAGVQEPETEVQPWLGVSLSPTLAIRVHRWVSLRVAPQMFVSIVRPGFDTTQGTLVYRASPVGGAFSAGIEFGEALRNRTDRSTRNDRRTDND
jgi:hypothetical protein